MTKDNIVKKRLIPTVLTHVFFWGGLASYVFPWFMDLSINIYRPVMLLVLMHVLFLMSVLISCFAIRAPGGGFARALISFLVCFIAAPIFGRLLKDLGLTKGFIDFLILLSYGNALLILIIAVIVNFRPKFVLTRKKEDAAKKDL